MDSMVYSSCSRSPMARRCSNRPRVLHSVSQSGRSPKDRKSTRLNSSHVATSYAVFCWKKKQPRVQVEDVARERLTARRTAEEQRELPVRIGLLRQVVVDDQRVLALVEEVLRHRAAGER